jgi:phenylalanyl-tRNA synthetase beta chain
MKCSYNWLREFVNLDGVTPGDLARALTMSGSIVEKVTEMGADIENVVVGRVVTVGKHPDADRLIVCSVDVGDGTPRQIVTGAPNLFEGAVVPVALDGSTLPGGVKIKKGKMRGVESQGMLCSIEELGLDSHDQPDAPEDGILILDDSFNPGADIVESLMLRDTTLEFEITNNRPDCLSVIGLAREAAATLRREFKVSAELAPAQGSIDNYAAVTVEDKTLCPRYSARVAENIKIGPSPVWMRRRLRACGVRPINNIVDITNYVMLETGQPMHAFDHALLKDNQIVVRTAREGEVLETLDGKKRTLTPDMLVIADARGAVAVAGVMGGAGSEVTENTKTIVFESANFNGPSVRKTALALAMRTDSSSRFEKGISPHTTTLALERACRLVEEIYAGTPLPGIADVSAPPNPAVKVNFTQEQIERHLGVKIPDLTELLESLGFTIETCAERDSQRLAAAAGSQRLVAAVPEWRRDVSIWQDLAEEGARLFGYDNIPTTMPPSKNQGWLTREQALRARLHELCVSLGFCEALTYSFIGPADFEKARMTQEGARFIGNPLGEEQHDAHVAAAVIFGGSVAQCRGTQPGDAPV